MIKANVIKIKTLEELWKYFDIEENVYVLAGGTDLVVKAKNNLIRESLWIDINSITELKGIRENENEIFIGALTNFTEISESRLLKTYAPALVSACSIIGSVQIRNMGTIGGNIANASPAGDSIPALYSLNAGVNIINRNGQKIIPIEEFFIGPGKTVMPKDSIIMGINILKRESIKGNFKRLGQRKGMAISKVSAAVSAVVNNNKIDYIGIALGAVAPVVLKVKKAEELLSGKEITDDILKHAKQLVETAAVPIDDIRSSQQYRKKMAGVLFEDAFAGISSK